MNARMVRMLHVEDDAMQQMKIAHHLKRIPEVHFAITCARSEEEAVAEFRRHPQDLVILDYHLSEGDGLNCLRSLRQCDAIVPIIAVSGQATNEIAAQLLKCGADDYINKRDLQSDILARSVRMALMRADAWRRTHGTGGAERVETALRQLCKGFTAAAGADFLRQLDEFDAAAREAGLTAEELDSKFNTVRGDLTAAQPGDAPAVARYLRPILLELRQRLADAETRS